MKTDYHDYVIKDGIFIGKFEDMYQNCDDPWGQSKDVQTSYSKMCSVASLSRLPLKSVLEIGCGLGYYTAFLQRVLPNLEVIGMDVSETAIKKAKDKFPTVSFVCENIKNLDRIVDKLSGIDALIFSEIMWYILDDLEDILFQLKRNEEIKYILINQTFYNGKQSYGKEYFTTPVEMILFFERFGFTSLCSIIEANEKHEAYSSHIVLIVLRKCFN